MLVFLVVDRLASIDGFTRNVLTSRFASSRNRRFIVAGGVCYVRHAMCRWVAGLRQLAGGRRPLEGAAEQAGHRGHRVVQCGCRPRAQTDRLTSASGMRLV